MSVLPIQICCCSINVDERPRVAVRSQTHSLQGKQSPAEQDDGMGDIKAAGNPQPRALTNSAVRRKTQDKGLLAQQRACPQLRTSRDRYGN